MGIKKQYQTIIVACAFTLLFVNTGFTSTSFSIYQSYIVNIPGVGDVGGSVVVTVRTFVSLICMFRRILPSPQSAHRILHRHALHRARVLSVRTRL